MINIKIEKCQINNSKITFLEFIISKNNLKLENTWRTIKTIANSRASTPSFSKSTNRATSNIKSPCNLSSHNSSTSNSNKIVRCMVKILINNKTFTDNNHRMRCIGNRTYTHNRTNLFINSNNKKKWWESRISKNNRSNRLRSSKIIWASKEQ